MNLRLTLPVAFTDRRYILATITSYQSSEVPSYPVQTLRESPSGGLTIFPSSLPGRRGLLVELAPSPDTVTRSVDLRKALGGPHQFAH
ncbi:hypothetical protein X777_14404 [Ooceraea biroi]|uniref:Uncharacterized protein n=1 Tax=Ooceraea biroi TaxID=2015173 RepID=A0A026VWH2_OOCBI|nr:hypothetical protein X777_14404 [Ooceraea biroi]